MFVDIDDESEVELDGNDQLNFDLDSEYSYDDLDLLSDLEDRAGSAEEFQWSPTLSRTGFKVETTNLLHSSPPVKFFKLFVTDDFVMAEHTNFYSS